MSRSPKPLKKRLTKAQIAARLARLKRRAERRKAEEDRRDEEGYRDLIRNAGGS